MLDMAHAVDDADSLEALPDFAATQHGNEWAEAGPSGDEPQLSALRHIGEGEEALRLALDQHPSTDFEAGELRRERAGGDFLEVKLQRGAGSGCYRIRAARELAPRFEPEVHELPGRERFYLGVDGERN